jgi:hypothetical protein
MMPEKQERSVDLPENLAEISAAVVAALLKMGIVIEAGTLVIKDSQLASEANLVPGTIVGTGNKQHKIRWTMADMWRVYESKVVIPSHNVSVIVNGVKMQFFANREMKVPAIFWDVYRDSVMEGLPENKYAWKQPGDERVFNDSEFGLKFLGALSPERDPNEIPGVAKNAEAALQ